MDRRRLAVLSLAPIARDSRVLRQVANGARRFDVTVVAWGELEDYHPHVTMRTIEPRAYPLAVRAARAAVMFGGRIRRSLLDLWYWSKPDHLDAVHALVDAQPELIHANEAIALPVATRAAQLTGASVLFDAHEYSPDQFKGDRMLGAVAEPFYRHVLARDAPLAAAMVAVSPGIAQRYEAELGVDCGVILNAPRYRPFALRHTDPEAIRLSYHGVALRGRRIEDLIAVVASCDRRFRLDLMLVPSEPGYVTELERLATQVAPGRVDFRSPVQPDRVLDAISGADIGLVLIPPLDFNYLMSLPNKFFDFIMAGVAVVVGPSPEMARICRQDGVGVVADSFDPEAVAARVRSLSAPEIDEMKSAALAAAKRFNAETELERLNALYDRILDAS